MSNILHVECADGQSLPYLGYIQCSLKAKGIDNNQVFVDGLFLIVPNTSYNECVPVLIGTNIISVLMNLVKESHGLRYLQEANLFAPWHLAFRCVSLRDKELQRHKNVLALVRLAESSRVTIPPNTDIVVKGYLHKELPYQPVCALLQTTSKSKIPKDLYVSPVLISYHHRQNGVVPVHISNITTRTVTLTPHALLCEVQPVSVENFTSLKDDCVSKEVDIMELTLQKMNFQDTIYKT